jgi:RNase H-fold protein (predicted Holliday junction resolvase)
MAGRFLKEKEAKIRERKAKEHKLAAQIILQDYLDKNV